MNSDNTRRCVRGGVLLCALSVGLLACIAAPRQVRAQDEAESQRARDYRELIDQALIEFKHKNWPEARVLFRRAHELSPNARTLRGMGVVSYEMRDYVQAVVALAAALVDTRQSLTDAQHKECEALLARSRTFVGTYVLSLEPAEAELRLDGAPLVRDAAGRVLVPLGEHVLSGSASGYQESTSRLSVQGAEQGELRIVLYRPTRLAASPTSSVETSVEVPPGSVRAGDSSRVRRAWEGHGLRYTWVALGASAAFGVGWAALWFVGQGKVDTLESNCARARLAGAPCREGAVDVSDVKRFERLSNAMFGLTVGASAATAVLAVFEWPRERKLALEVQGPRVSLRGTF